MKYPQDVPVLTDGVVTLRAHREADVPAIVEMCADPEMQRWTSVPLDNSLEDSRRFATETMKTAWEQMNHRGWAIEANDDGGMARFAGNIDIRDSPVATVGYALHPWARGRGVITKALDLAGNWAFTEGGVEIIQWASHVGNVPSLRAAWAAGFTLNGTQPGILYERGQVIDAWTAYRRFGEKPGPKTTWLDSPVVEGANVRLRPFRMDDVPRIVETCTDETSQYWLAELPKPYTETTARDYLHTSTWLAATGNKATWAVADRSTDQLVANIAIMGLDNDPTSGEVGYWAHPEARGKGLMTEATGLLVEHAFGAMNLRRLSLMAATANTASNKVALKNGFVVVGTETRSEPLGDGTFADMNVYELFPPA
ncbi:MAG: GNAT family N-acetyltransferase [Aeromicrobium sp.]